MGSRTNRRRRENTQQRTEVAGSTGPVASPPMTNSGANSLDAEVRSVGEGGVVHVTARSFNWKRRDQRRFPTRLSPEEIRLLASLEKRPLSIAEQAILDLSEVASGYSQKPETFRDVVRSRKQRADAAKALLALEGVSNQSDEHERNRRKNHGFEIPPATQKVTVNVRLDALPADERRTTLLALADKFRTGSGTGVDSGRAPGDGDSASDRGVGAIDGGPGSD